MGRNPADWNKWLFLVAANSSIPLCGATETLKETPQFVIRMATVDTVRQALSDNLASIIRPHDNSCASIYHPLGPWSVRIEPSESAVLFDPGAAFCTQILIFNDGGLALHMHDALISGYTVALDSFLKRAKRSFGSGEVSVIISGTNLELSDDPSNSRDLLFANLDTKVKKALPNSRVEFMVSRSQQANQIYAPYFDSGDKVRGFFFIPRHVSRLGINEILAITQSHEKDLYSTYPRLKRQDVGGCDQLFLNSFRG